MAEHAHADHQRRETEIQIRACLPETDTLVVRGLGRMAYAAFGAADYVARHPAARSAARYADCAWVGLSPERAWFPEQGRWLAERLGRPPALYVNAMTTAFDLVVQGAGLALLPAFMGAAEPRLVALTRPIGALATEEHLIVHRDLLREPAVRRAVNAIAAVYRADRARLLGTVPVAPTPAPALVRRA
ncbi:MAG: LysR substrate-binding domain-containing protein [Paracoccaceae bacterium]